MSSVASIDRRSVTDFMRLYQIQNRYDDWYRNRQIVEYTFLCTISRYLVTINFFINVEDLHKSFLNVLKFYIHMM